jgi:hypothetical protein
MSAPVFIVPCGDKKLPHAAPARDLYTGSQFRYVFPLADAAARRTGGEVFILSALHGLVEPDRVLEPYNKKMGDSSSITARQLAEQVRELGLARRDVYAFLARPYYERLEEALAAEGGHAVDVFDVPTKTARGGRIQLGEQKTVARQFLEGFVARPASRPASRPAPRPTAPARASWLEDEYAYLDERFSKALAPRRATNQPEQLSLLALMTEGDAGETNVVAKTSDGRRWQETFDTPAEAQAAIAAIEERPDDFKVLPRRVSEDPVPDEVEALGDEVVEADMAQGDSVDGLRCVYFASGSNHPGEIEGLSSIGFNVGVAASEVKSAEAIDALLALAGTGIRVFVDSGAFGEVDFNFPNTTGRPKKNRRSKRQIERGMVDTTPPGGLPYPTRPVGPLILDEITPAQWRIRLQTYRVLAEGLGSQVYLVAPDCVGHQDETISRLQTYASEIRALRDLGANIIVAMQKAVTLDARHLDPDAPGIPLGRLSREALDARIESILGFDDFVRGMPMRNRTTTPDEVVAFLKARPHVTRIHLLGFGPASRGYVRTLKKLAEARPDTRSDLDLTCDSVLLVAHKGKANGPGGGPRRLTKAEDEYWYGELGPESFADDTGLGDYTEAISEVASWLPRSAREQLADRWLLDNVQRRAWLKDPESWLQQHYRDDPERPKHYELPQIAVDLDQAWADYNFREKVTQRKRTGIQRAFGEGSGFVLGGEGPGEGPSADVDEE